MSFTPLSNNLSTALSGAFEPSKFIDIRDIRDIRSEDLYSRRIHEPVDRTQTIKYTIIIVIISALIFVTVIALYDIVRNVITNYYANLALIDPNSHNTPEDIQRTQIANSNGLWSSIVFATVCLISAIILILILSYFLRS